MPNAEGSFEDVREEVEGHPMRNLFGYVLPYWKRLSAGIVAAFAMRLSRLVPALAVAAAIDRVVTSEGSAGLLARAGLVTSQPVPAAATDARLALLYQLALVAAGAWVVQAVSQWSSRYLFQSTAQMIQHDLRQDTYAHMHRLSMDFFNDHQTGGMMSILNSDVNRLENFFNSEIRQIIRAVVMVGVVGAVMFWLNWQLALVALLPLPIIGLATAKFMMWIEPKYKRIRETVARLNTRLSNNLGGAAVIKSFDRYDVEEERVDEQSETYRDEKVSVIRVRKAFFSSLRVVVGGVFVAVLLLGGRAVLLEGGDPLVGSLTLGTLTLFFMFLRRLRGPMRRLGKTANKYQKAKSSAERVFGILGHDPTITSPEDAHAPDEVDGHVEFDDVVFSYEGTDETILDGVSLDVEAGQTVGFAGTSGSGKSTLLKLVPRYHDVDSGSVRIDGTDVREYDVQSLRDEIGIVEQNPYMFSGTVRENIAYGDHDAFRSVYEADDPAEVPDEVNRRVRAVAQRAGADEFISDLPDGYDTQVGERGVKLSGGQRQRVSIARALINDPSIIVLDEATSDVDTETEQIIQENLDELIDDRTAFVIAHRLSTIQDADRIVVMEDGEIIETGTHDRLVREEEGTYADLWEKQASMSSVPAASADD
ncbi:MAG: ABC transporter ATP-binding protein [Halobacteriaceae archaeon]